MFANFAEMLNEAGFRAVEQRLDDLELEWSCGPPFLENHRSSY